MHVTSKQMLVGEVTPVAIVSEGTVTVPPTVSDGTVVSDEAKQ
jgi:hypothetical protein